MAVTTTPIVHIIDTEANLTGASGLGAGQIGLASDSKRFIVNVGGTFWKFAPQFVGLTLQDVEAASVVANVEFQGDGGSLSGIVGENITCLTSITGLTASNLSLALAELKGLVTALTTAGYLPLAGGALTGPLSVKTSTLFPCNVVRDTGATATGLWYVHQIMAETTGDMVDGFGCGTAWSIKDSAGVDNVIADVYAYRNGADNTGKVIHRVRSAGTAVEVMSLDKDQATFSKPIVGQRIKLTAEGGYAVLYTAGENLAVGELVSASTAADDRVVKAAADSFSVIGAVYAAATSGNTVWIVTSGRAQVLLQNSTASTRGYWARTSTTTAGRADITNAAPPGGTVAALEVHATEIGHCVESVTAGTDKLAWINMHFN